MRGTVSSFDADGWGVVEAAEGGSHPFHCTAIVDGTRSIDPGAPVVFVLVPGRQGRWEATALTPATAPFD
jgi:cold shock CspA family protein